MKLYIVIICLLSGLLIALVASYSGSFKEKPAEYSFEDAINNNLGWPGLVDSQVRFEDVPLLEVANGESVLIADSSINDFATGFAVNVGGTNWFIPEIIAEWHPIIKISSGGEQIYFTFDVFCRSGSFYSESINYSGKYYQGNLLLEKNSDYFWQLSGRNLTGGSDIQNITYRTMIWDSFKELYPSGRAVSLITGFDRDYGRHPYGSYMTDDKIYFPTTSRNSDHSPKDNIFFTRVDSENININEELESEQAFWHCLQNQFDIISL